MISIAIPAYNYAQYLPNAIHSILLQDIVDIEVLIFDDCSTDDTQVVVEAFCRKDARVKYFRNAENLGATLNINQAMRHVSGEYVVLLGADDMLEAGSLSMLKTVLDEHPECGYAYGRYTMLDDIGRTAPLQHPGWLAHDYFGDRDEFPELLKFDLYINIGASMFRRSVIADRDFFDTSLSVFDDEAFFRATDLDLMLRLSLQGVKSAFVNRNISMFRVHNAQASSVDRYAISGLAFFEYSLLLLRYFNVETVARLQPHMHGILQTYANKFTVFSQHSAPEYEPRVQQAGLLIKQVMTELGQLVGDYNQAKAAEQAALQLSPSVPSGDRTQGDCFFTVICTIYDRPHLAVAALQSIASQSFRDFELIVVNDGGVPQESLVDMFAKIGNVTYVRQPNRGVAAARNLALALARGRYIVYLDDDDIMLENHLGGLHKAALENPGALVFGDAEVVDEQLVSGVRKELKRSVMACPQYDLYRLQVFNYIPINVLAHPRDVVESLGGFDESLPSHEDWEFLIRLSRKIPFVHYQGATVEIRRRIGGGGLYYDSRTGKAWNGIREDFVEIYRRHDDMGIPQIKAAREKVLATPHPIRA